MRRTNILHIVLELIVVIGSFIIGGTILTCFFLQADITRILVGLITIAIGMIGAVEFLTLKLELRLKSIQSLVLYGLAILLGLLLIFIRIDGPIVCYIWGSFFICFALARAFTSAVNLLKQPLLNIVRIVSGIVVIVFSIILLVKNVDFVGTYFIFIGIIMLIDALILLIEFIIHRFQNL